MLSKGQMTYLLELKKCLSQLETQSQIFEKVCSYIYDTIKNDGVLHVFGSGHSTAVTEELFHRAGGLVPVNPLFEEMLMPHMGPKHVGPLERLKGIGELIFNAHDLREKEPILIVSNSGINASAVELAEVAKSKGLFVIAITSLTHSKAVPSRSGKKLYEIADAVLDTGTPVGDACVGLENSDVKVAPLSAVMSLTIAELIVVRVAELFSEKGEQPPIYQSANVPGGEARNKAWEDKYRSRIKRL